MGIHTMSYRAI